MTEPARLQPGTLRLVAVTDSLRDGTDGLVARAAQAVAGGATMLQLRLKDESPRTLVEVARRLRAACPTVPLLVNARADVALASGAAGVHLGVDDLLPVALRRVVPSAFVIGASAGDEAQADFVEGADYVAVGPVFAASGVPSPADGGRGMALLRAVATRARIPVLAVGGLTVGNVAQAMEAGATGIVVLSEILGAADPMQHARALRDALDATGR